MRIVVGSLAIVALMASSFARGEGPILAKLNRYFGLGWGDGYHAGWNDCSEDSGQNGGEACQPSAADAESLPNAPAPQPAPAPSGEPSATGNFHLPQPEAMATPRLVRLPPVVEAPQLTRRLPPVTDLPRMSRLPPVHETPRVTHRPAKVSPRVIESR
jgi:hypothetical protein